MPESVDLGYAVSLPPREAISYFKSKGYAISWNWWEVWREQHAKAFTVAKATRLDVLASIRGAQQRALSEGLTERQFIKELEPRLRAQGWWGRQFVSGPEGLEVAQLGSPWRLKTIYRTNTLAAYNAGRYRAQAENTDARPYWQYLQLQRENKREAHAVFHRRVFPADDPIWSSIYPPNGFRCACRVRTLTGGQVDSLGLGVDSSAGKIGRATVDVGVDKRSGEIIQREVFTWNENGRSYKWQPGWDYNPGQAWPLWDARGRFPDALPGEAVGATVARITAGQKTWRDYGRPDAREVPDALKLAAPPILDKAADAEAAEALLAGALGVAETGTRVIQTPVSEVALRRELLSHMVEKRADARERYANFVLPTLQDPYEVYLAEYDDGPWRERYIGLFKEAPGLALVVRLNSDGSLFWNFMHTSQIKELNRHRSGTLLWGKE